MYHALHSPILYLLMLSAVIAEWFWRKAVARRGYNTSNALASVGIGVGRAVFGILSAVVVGGVYMLASQWAPVHWSMTDWRVWVVCFVLVEFAYYWFHRLSHTVRWLWATHAVHHSPEEMTFLAAVRLGWTSLFSMGWLLYLPLIFAGFDPRMVMLLIAADLHYQFFLHTEAISRLGPLEWVLNTPAHHRVHHGSNEQYLDCNYGGVLIIFDRMFGTLRLENKDEPIRYGLVHPIGSHNPFVIAFAEWKNLFRDMYRAGGVKRAARIALGRP